MSEPSRYPGEDHGYSEDSDSSEDSEDSKHPKLPETSELPQPVEHPEPEQFDASELDNFFGLSDAKHETLEGETEIQQQNIRGAKRRRSYTDSIGGDVQRPCQHLGYLRPNHGQTSSQMFSRLWSTWPHAIDIPPEAHHRATSTLETEHKISPESLCVGPSSQALPAPVNLQHSVTTRDELGSVGFGAVYEADGSLKAMYERELVSVHDKIPKYDTSIAKEHANKILEIHKREGVPWDTAYGRFIEGLDLELQCLEQTPDYSYVVAQVIPIPLLPPSYDFDSRNKRGDQLVDLELDLMMRKEERDFCKAYDTKRFVIHTLFIVFEKLGLSPLEEDTEIRRILAVNVPNGSFSNRVFGEFNCVSIQEDEKKFMTAVNRKAEFESEWYRILEHNILTRHAIWLLARMLSQSLVWDFYSHPDLFLNIGGLCQTLDLLIRNALKAASDKDKQQAHADWKKEVDTWEKHRQALGLPGYKEPAASLDGTFIFREEKPAIVSIKREMSPNATIDHFKTNPSRLGAASDLALSKQEESPRILKAELLSIASLLDISVPIEGSTSLSGISTKLAPLRSPKSPRPRQSRSLSLPSIRELFGSNKVDIMNPPNQNVQPDPSNWSLEHEMDQFAIADEREELQIDQQWTWNTTPGTDSYNPQQIQGSPSYHQGPPQFIRQTSQQTVPGAFAPPARSLYTQGNPYAAESPYHPHGAVPQNSRSQGRNDHPLMRTSGQQQTPAPQHPRPRQRNYQQQGNPPQAWQQPSVPAQIGDQYADVFPPGTLRTDRVATRPIATRTGPTPQRFKPPSRLRKSRSTAPRQEHTRAPLEGPVTQNPAGNVPAQPPMFAPSTDSNAPGYLSNSPPQGTKWPPNNAQPQVANSQAQAPSNPPQFVATLRPRRPPPRSQTAVPFDRRRSGNVPIVPQQQLQTYNAPVDSRSIITVGPGQQTCSPIPITESNPFLQRAAGKQGTPTLSPSPFQNSQARRSESPSDLTSLASGQEPQYRRPQPRHPAQPNYGQTQSWQRQQQQQQQTQQVPPQPLQGYPTQPQQPPEQGPLQTRGRQAGIPNPLRRRPQQGAPRQATPQQQSMGPMAPVAPMGQAAPAEEDPFNFDEFLNWSPEGGPLGEEELVEGEPGRKRKRHNWFDFP